jgi:hypothetical protein
MVCGEADMERAVHSRLRLSVLERGPREVLLLTQKIKTGGKVYENGSR